MRACDRPTRFPFDAIISGNGLLSQDIVLFDGWIPFLFVCGLGPVEKECDTWLGNWIFSR